MKTLFTTLISWLLVHYVAAQTISTGEHTVDKTKMPGLFLTLPMDSRLVERDWEAYLKKLGRVSSSRGVYRISNADIRDLSPEPVNVVSQLTKESRAATTLFVAFDLGAGNYVTGTSSQYGAAERLLRTFASDAQYNQEVRLAQVGFDEAEKEHQKHVRAGERLVRDIERNAREKENLQKRLVENAEELEKLKKDVETNKATQATALTELENRKRAVEAVKAKRAN